jgi:DNA-binding phage protein
MRKVILKVVPNTAPDNLPKKKGGALSLNKSYNFVDKAEIIDKLRTAMDDAGLTLSVASNKSGVTRQTMRRWFNGKVMRPQVPTLNAVGKLVGLKLAWTYSNE